MPIEHSPAGPDLRQLAAAYKEALESPDIRVTRMGLEILWRRLEKALAEPKEK